MELLKKAKIAEILKPKSANSFPIIGKKNHVIAISKYNELGFIFTTANFQSGLPINTDEIIAKRVDDVDGGTKFSLIATPNNVYKADISNPGSQLVNTFLAVRNRRTNCIKLIPVKSANFKHSAFDDTHSIYENNIVDVKKVMAKEFGGKKALAGYEKTKKSQPNIEVLEESLEKQLNKLDDNKFFEKDLLESAAGSKSMLIFPNIDVSDGVSVRDVFNVKKLIGIDTVEFLSEAAVELLNMDQKTIKLASNYLTLSVKAIQTRAQPDSPENLEKVALLLYIDSLVRLQNNKKRKWDQVALSPFSPSLAHEIRKKFTTQGNIANSKSTKQKGLIFYIILMLMSTETLAIDISHLLEGIADLTKTDLLKYAQIIGAKVKDGTILYIQKVNIDKNSQFNVPMKSGKRKRNA